MMSFFGKKTTTTKPKPKPKASPAAKKAAVAKMEVEAEVAADAAEEVSPTRTIKRRKKANSGKKAAAKKRKLRARVDDEDDDDDDDEGMGAGLGASARSSARESGKGTEAAVQDLFLHQEKSRMEEADGEAAPDMRTEEDLEKARAATKWATMMAQKARASAAEDEVDRSVIQTVKLTNQAARPRTRKLVTKTCVVSSRPTLRYMHSAFSYLMSCTYACAPPSPPPRPIPPNYTTTATSMRRVSW